jgi:hypothetical protein
MKTVYFLLFCCTFFLQAIAQDETPYKEPGKASSAQHDYRTWEAEPPYGLTKIKALIAKIKPEESTEGDGGTEKINPATYNALTLREKFTYHMIHGESYSQNCDAMPPIQDEDKKIFGYLPDIFGESSWGERQQKFLISNRDSVMQWIKALATKDKRVGLNYKQALVDINAVEMIPFLINIYKANKKDRDILSVLMWLMKNNEYQPFIVSASNKKLFTSDAYSSYNAFLVYNAANEELIIKRATDFYNGQKAK